MVGTDLVWDCSRWKGWTYGKYDRSRWRKGKIEQVAHRDSDGRVCRTKEFGNRHRGQRRAAERAG
eukprot:6695016-Alexandrium_andersonii.AAC.1